jgi:hypothetical protein
MSIVLCVLPIVGTIERLTMMGTNLIVERRVPIVMGMDRCTMTSGRWYRTHAERGGKEMEGSRMDSSSVRAGSSQSKETKGLSKAF